jgi:iron complex outermembrane receptor protein
MKKITAFFWALLFFVPTTFAQIDTSDNAVILTHVTIRAFGQNRHITDVTASVNYVSHTDLSRFNDMSLLPALNNTAGVRMEERSPGSYRMNIRGSTLRSPFGVRNVKVYWNDLPLTDPGGNTYLNQISLYNVQSVEIIKGPGSSLYGSGSGGVILLNGIQARWQEGITVNASTGSYGLKNFNIELRGGKDDHRNTLDFAHQESDGYRSHTAMRRDVVSFISTMKATAKQELKAVMLYGDLYYQTPGGLTKAEYDSAARMARPKAGTLPGADQAKAAIYQKTLISGFSNKFILSDHWQNNTVVYGAFTSFKNPTFRTYERRSEPHFGGRTSFQWQKQMNGGLIQLLFGTEAQRGFFNTKTFSNVNGNPGTVQTDDDLSNWTYFLFAQADLKLKGNWNITVGASTNKSSVTITRLTIPSFVPIKRVYNNEWAPRVAVTKKVIKEFWLYGSISKGFSPPTVAELLPGTVNINTSLQPEEGTNTEFGIKGQMQKGRLYVELTHFSYKLKNAIVVRKDAVNGDYYVNAGSSNQYGTEFQVMYNLFLSNKELLNDARFSVAFTNYDFHYGQFKQGNNDYSGKRLPSVAPNTLALAADFNLKYGLFLNLNYFYSGAIYLNDNNSARASQYQLMAAKLGCRVKAIKAVPVEVFVGGENLFNERYSLGNDINAAGDRFYNTAPGRNFYAGLKVQWNRKSE